MPQEVADNIIESLGKADLGSPFGLSAEGIGGFPKLSAPRVIWTGLGGNLTALAALQKTAEKCAFKCGIPNEKRGFSPHITLGRRNETGPLPHDILAGIADEKLTLAPWTVEEIIFMRSELTPRGPVYTPLKKFPLPA